MFRALLVTVAIFGGAAISTAPAAVADPPYRTCKDAAVDGKYNMTKDDPGYADHLDRDHDGIACESK